MPAEEFNNLRQSLIDEILLDNKLKSINRKDTSELSRVGTVSIILATTEIDKESPVGGSNIAEREMAFALLRQYYFFVLNNMRGLGSIPAEIRSAASGEEWSEALENEILDVQGFLGESIEDASKNITDGLLVKLGATAVFSGTGAVLGGPVGAAVGAALPSLLSFAIKRLIEGPINRAAKSIVFSIFGSMLKAHGRLDKSYGIHLKCDGDDVFNKLFNKFWANADDDVKWTLNQKALGEAVEAATIVSELDRIEKSMRIKRIKPDPTYLASLKYATKKAITHISEGAKDLIKEQQSITNQSEPTLTSSPRSPIDSFTGGSAINASRSDNDPCARNRQPTSKVDSDEKNIL